MLREAFVPIIENVIGTPADHLDKSVSFLHPGYTFGDNVLLRLPAPDGHRGGIDYELALHACAILACNRFDGYFTDASATLQDEVRVEPNQDGIILPGEYFFRVPASSTVTGNEPYPVVASFYDWQFPHEFLPSAWRNEGTASSTAAAAVSNLRTPVASLAERDQICRLSGCQEMLQQAHVVPEGEWEWFASNGMRRYTVQGLRHGVDLLSNIENKMLLRSDLHMLWDSRAFVFVPKGVSGTPVAHVLQESVELLALYHNRKTQPLFARRELLFARLAWAIFPFMRSFLNARQSRRVVVRKNSGEAVVQSLSGDQCAAIVEQRKRSISPKKRKLQEQVSGTVQSKKGQAAAKPELELPSNSPGADSGYAAVEDPATDDDRVSTDGTLRRLKRSNSRSESTGAEEYEQEMWGEERRGRKRRRRHEFDGLWS